MSPPDSRPKARLALLASGRGSHVANIVAACASGLLNAEVAVVISNRLTSGALQEAKQRNIPVSYIASASSNATPGREKAADEQLATLLKSYQTDWVITAVYLKKIGPVTLASFENRILNIHPSLLPAFGGPGMYGLHVHRAVLAAGETRTGATVHFVNKDYDQGAIIEQVNLEIPQGLKSPEALAAKVLPAEHKLLLQVLQRMVANHD